MTTLHIEPTSRGYDVSIGRGLIYRADEFFDLNRKTLIVTDSGVPSGYAKAVADRASEALTVTLNEGEGSKSLANAEKLCQSMLEAGFGRRDCVVAVGGGVVGDLAGFAASMYMRGIDFYNIPTTLLSQVDSSIGGKTAVNLCGVKNVIGAFYQPRGVIIDADVLSTLPKRHISSGLAEALKMAITSDKELFALIESGSIDENLEKIILGALKIKKSIVEADEREVGLRKVLNFGHTLGHGIESVCEMKGMYHGECVALGMIPMCSVNLQKRVIPVLNKIGIDVTSDYDLEGALSYVVHDKKCSDGKIDAVFSDEVGTFRLERLGTEEYASLVRAALGR